MVGPAAKREAAAHLKGEFQMSERRACGLIKADRQMVCYRSTKPLETALRTLLRELANERRRFGYRRLFIMLRREGEASGINRIYRLYREGGLGVRRRKGRKRAVGMRAPILVEARPNARWSLDFVHDQSILTSQTRPHHNPMLRHSLQTQGTTRILRKAVEPRRRHPFLRRL